MPLIPPASVSTASDAGAGCRACDALKRCQTLTAAGHKGAAVTSDSKQTSAASKGLELSAEAVCAEHGRESDVLADSASRGGSPAESAEVMGSPISRLVPCATMANNPFDAREMDGPVRTGLGAYSADESRSNEESANTTGVACVREKQGQHRCQRQSVHWKWVV